MKNFFLTLCAFIFSLNIMAQLNGDGYYRIKNVGSQRYLYVTDNKGSINASSASADLGAVKLYRDFSNAVSDPATILYIKQSSGGYRFEAQGTDSHEIIGYDLLISAQSDGTYKAYQQQGFLRAYLCDARIENTAEGVLSTKKSDPIYQKWNITPVSTGSEYFGITPEVSYGGAHYGTLYASFPYTFASPGMMAYYVSAVDNGVAVLAPVAGNAVPAGMPVVVKVSSTDPANNKLNIAPNSATVSTDNKLGGVYFCNTSKGHNNVTAYDANTMRVLGLTSNGKLGFVKATNDMLVYDKNNKLYCLPANKAYLVVPSGTPDELEVMTKEEYDNRSVNVTATATTGGTVAGGGVYKVNTQATLTATAQTGYHFVRWSDGSTANPYTFTATTNTSLTATFEPSSYQLVYMLDGVQHHTESVVYGTALTALAAPAKEGCTFSGWSGLPATMPASDVTVTGSFTPNTYQISYVVDGTAYQTVSATYGTTLTPIDFPTKEGHTFSGWSGLPATMPASDVTVTGSFTPNTYRISYVVDGTVYHTESATYGITLTPIDFPTKEGHTFSGWTGLPATMPACNVTVTGSFTPNEYLLTYLVDGAIHHTESVVYGTMLVEIQEPTKEGHTFSGWTGLPVTMPAGEVTITGSFEVNYYEFIHMLDGEVYKNDSVAYGSSLELEPEPVKEGYTFSGWSEVPATMPAAKVVVTGKMVPNIYQVTYLVDGAVYLIDSIACDAPFKARPVPVQAGYNFDGWDNVPATMPAGDIVLSGMFVINKDNKFNLVYMLDGQEYKRAVVSFGDTLTVEPDPVKEGYTFSGWSGLPETMPLQDVTVTGEFSVNHYLLTYVLDGETYFSDSLAYGDRLVLPEVADKEGYTFSGWRDAPKTMPFEDLTLSGEYLINYYLLTYVVDGEVYAQDSLAYGQTIELRDDLVKEGYIFSGWSEAPETMPAANVKVLAIFTVDGIEDVVTEHLVDVYTLQGVRVKSQVSLNDLQRELPAGIYIVNGRKVLVK